MIDKPPDYAQFYETCHVAQGNKKGSVVITIGHADKKHGEKNDQSKLNL